MTGTTVSGIAVSGGVGVLVPSILRGSALSAPSLPGLFALKQQRQALAARHRGAILRRNPLHLGAMSRLSVARIAQNHAVSIEGVQVAFLSSVP